MKEIEFKIFTKNKGFRITVNIVVYSLLLASIGIAYLGDTYFDEIVIKDIGLAGGILACILVVYFKITQSFKRKPLNGSLNRSLKFRANEILIDNKKYELNEIRKIEFSVEDYFDKWESHAPGDLSPAKTNGTSNICEIILANGQKSSVNFQLNYRNEFLKMRELLIKYYAENKIHFLKLIEYLRIEEYEEIQAFKKTLPK